MRAVLRVVGIAVGLAIGALVVLLVVARVTGTIRTYVIPSAAMEPTLHCARPEVGCEAKLSDRVIANTLSYRLHDPRRGDIVVFRTPAAALVKCGVGGTFVKRIIGLPGDTIRIRLRLGNGYVYVNGEPLDEPYVDDAQRSSLEPFGPVTVRSGTYFVLGDARAQSCDSRYWGTVPRKNLIGKVSATYWPPNRVSVH